MLKYFLVVFLFESITVPNREVTKNQKPNGVNRIFTSITQVTKEKEYKTKRNKLKGKKLPSNYILSFLISHSLVPNQWSFYQCLFLQPTLLACHRV